MPPQCAGYAANSRLVLKSCGTELAGLPAKSSQRANDCDQVPAEHTGGGGTRFRDSRVLVGDDQRARRIAAVARVCTLTAFAASPLVCTAGALACVRVAALASGWRAAACWQAAAMPVVAASGR